MERIPAQRGRNLDDISVAFAGKNLQLLKRCSILQIIVFYVTRCEQRERQIHYVQRELLSSLYFSAPIRDWLM